MVHLLLIHGLNGSDQSTTGKTLKRVFGSAVHTPNMPNNPVDWYGFLLGYIEDNFKDELLVLLGNSTGGLFASWIAHARNLPLVLINPVIDARDLRRFVGVNRKFSTGEEWFFSDADVDLLRQYEMPKPTLPALVFLGEYDEVLDPQKTAARYEKRGRIVLNGNSHQYRLSESDLKMVQDFCNA